MPSAGSLDIELKKVVYDDFINEPRKGRKAVAIPDKEFVFLNEYYQSKAWVVRPVSAVVTRMGQCFIKKERFPAVEVSATIKHPSKTEAIVTLDTYEGPMAQVIYEYRLTKTPKGWRIAKKEFVMAS